jgi:hypothetical protein
LQVKGAIIKKSERLKALKKWKGKQELKVILERSDELAMPVLTPELPLTTPRRRGRPPKPKVKCPKCPFIASSPSKLKFHAKVNLKKQGFSKCSE